MRRSLTLFFLVLIGPLALWAQTNTPVTGRLVDADTKETIPGASLTVTAGSKKLQLLSAVDGRFTFVITEKATLEISSVGYLSKTVEVEPGASLGDISVANSQVAMKEVIVTGNIAIDRKTPIAVSTIRAGAIEERIGNKEFPEILRTMPGTYITKSGGGFGDSRINVRGFAQTNTAVMINGVPVNDMESGAVYWSNWAGLADIASSVQVQRGLGASKLSIAAVGGNINIVTKATEMEKGGQASATIGNDGYMKYTVGYNTGKGKNGLALSLLGSYTQGNGYVDGTKFKGWNYFLTLGWEINDKHTITLTATGAPQWHHQRSAAISYATLFGNPNDATTVVRGAKYNDSWGYYKGKEFSWSKNFYHKPVANLNYYWKINNRTDFSAVLYASLGRGGGTGPIGSIPNSGGTPTTYSGFTTPDDANGLVRFDDIEKWNSGVTPSPAIGSLPSNPQWTLAGPYQGKYVADLNGNGIIRRASMNEHNWYGSILNLTHDINSAISVNGGLDLRYYKGLHYRRVEDGLGVAAYYETKDLNNPGKYVAADDQDGTIDYNNDGIVKQVGGYVSAEYNKNKWSLFAAGSLSNTNYQRIDHFLYNKKTNPIWESAKKDFTGFVVKGGANYRLTDKHNVFANVGYFERAPFFNTVWPNNNNVDVNKNITNEKIFSVEAGYGFRSKLVSANVNVYRTEWKDKNFNQTFTDPSSGQQFRSNIAGLIALHQGIEFETTIRPINKLEIQGMLSLGDWKWKNNVSTVVTNDNSVPIDTVYIYTKGLKVGDAAQTTLNLSAGYEIIKGLKIRASYYFADNLYANFTPENRSNAAQEGVQAWKLPSYGLLDGMLSYTIKFNGTKVTFRLNVDNILDEEYIAESTTDNKYNPNPGTTGYDAKDFIIGNNGSGKKNTVYPGFGRTWTLGAKVNF
ncbi:TonB-dependent receptor [Pseudoflavitalea sp. X16]|uniref:TonB-dependent receptor n=1 Tax=Paraflavitalea devenefica TaxID=2716334 RepID=UPI001422FB3D|nr:TonB-dependent receptor [Paraflavitalea devenefica]NII25767.1 TonB-dependent receptor [Paraflavitalea devenefica]